MEPLAPGGCCSSRTEPVSVRCLSLRGSDFPRALGAHRSAHTPGGPPPTCSPARRCSGDRPPPPGSSVHSRRCSRSSWSSSPLCQTTGRPRPEPAVSRRPGPAVRPPTPHSPPRAQPTLLAEAALPAADAVAAEAADAVGAVAMPAAQAVAQVLRGQGLALVAICQTVRDVCVHPVLSFPDNSIETPREAPSPGAQQSCGKGENTHRRTWTKRSAVERGAPSVAVCVCAQGSSTSRGGPGARGEGKGLQTNRASGL